jgi:hypothetical protein
MKGSLLGGRVIPYKHKEVDGKVSRRKNIKEKMGMFDHY